MRERIFISKSAISDPWLSVVRLDAATIQHLMLTTHYISGANSIPHYMEHLCPAHGLLFWKYSFNKESRRIENTSPHQLLVKNVEILPELSLLVLNLRKENNMLVMRNKDLSTCWSYFFLCSPSFLIDESTTLISHHQHFVFSPSNLIFNFGEMSHTLYD